MIGIRLGAPIEDFFTEDELFVEDVFELAPDEERVDKVAS